MADPRLTDLKDLGNATNDEGLALGNQFPFKVCPTVEDWDARREKLTRQLLVANGMWPIPEDRPPPVATVHGRVEREGYTVDRGERPRSPLPSYPPPPSHPTGFSTLRGPWQCSSRRAPGCTSPARSTSPRPSRPTATPSSCAPTCTRPPTPAAACVPTPSHLTPTSAGYLPAQRCLLRRADL